MESVNQLSGEFAKGCYLALCRDHVAIVNLFIEKKLLSAKDCVDIMALFLKECPNNVDSSAFKLITEYTVTEHC